MKQRILILLTVFAMLFTAGCKKSGSAAKEDGRTVITFWHSMGGNLNEAIDKMVADYNASQDKYLVKAEFQGEYDDALTKLRSASSGSALDVDIVQVFELGARFMIDSGLITPVQEMIDKTNFNTADLEPNLLAYYTIDGKLNSMPFNSSTPLLYYNKDMFKKAGITEVPKSLEEMVKVGEELKAKGVEMPLSMSIYGWWVDQFMLKQQKPLFDMNNGRGGNPTKTVFVENGGMENILERWKELADKGIAPNVGRTGGKQEFVSGVSAMTFGSTASLAGILQEVGDKFEVGTAYYPAVNKDDKGMVSIGGASLYMIDSGSDERKAGAWDFISYMVSPKSQAYWNANSGYFPVNVKAHDEDVFKENIKKFPQFQTAIDQLHDSTPESQGAICAVYQESRQVFEKYVEDMLNGVKTPKEAAEAMQKDIDSAINDYNRANNK